MLMPMPLLSLLPRPYRYPQSLGLVGFHVRCSLTASKALQEPSGSQLQARLGLPQSQAGIILVEGLAPRPCSFCMLENCGISPGWWCCAELGREALLFTPCVDGPKQPGRPLPTSPRSRGTCACTYVVLPSILELKSSCLCLYACSPLVRSLLQTPHLQHLYLSTLPLTYTPLNLSRSTIDTLVY